MQWANTNRIFPSGGFRVNVSCLKTVMLPIKPIRHTFSDKRSALISLLLLLLLWPNPCSLLTSHIVVHSFVRSIPDGWWLLYIRCELMEKGGWWFPVFVWGLLFELLNATARLQICGQLRAPETNGSVGFDQRSYCAGKLKRRISRTINALRTAFKFLFPARVCRKHTILLFILYRVESKSLSRVLTSRQNEFRKLEPKLDQAFNEFSVYLIPPNEYISRIRFE